MHEKERQIEVMESSGSLGPTEIATQPIIWSMTANPQKPPDFQSVLLAIAGHDLRQPLQVIGNVHDLLRQGPRTASELRLLRYSQSAVDRLREQLDELLAALRLYEDVKGLKLMPVRVGPLLQKVCHLDAAIVAAIRSLAPEFETAYLTDSLPRWFQHQLDRCTVTAEHLANGADTTFIEALSALLGDALGYGQAIADHDVPGIVPEAWSPR